MQSGIKKTGKKPNNLVKPEKFTKFFSRIFSRHPSHAVLRKKLLLPFRSVVRFGSTTESMYKVQCNSVQAVKNSADKLLMKQCFTEAEVVTAPWIAGTGPEDAITAWAKERYPIVAKYRFGSRGTGNYKLDTEEQLKQWMAGKKLTPYIFEEYLGYAREYRLHVTEDGCFYTCRKMIKEETPKDKRWFRNDSNCVWIIDTNPNFDKPTNWKKIEEECIKALKAVGLDIGAFDVRVQAKDKKEPKFFIVESGSAPSFGDITAQKYAEVLPKVLKKKFIELNA